MPQPASRSGCGSPAGRCGKGRSPRSARRTERWGDRRPAALRRSRRSPAPRPYQRPDAPRKGLPRTSPPRALQPCRPLQSEVAGSQAHLRLGDAADEHAFEPLGGHPGHDGRMGRRAQQLRQHVRVEQDAHPPSPRLLARRRPQRPPASRGRESARGRRSAAGHRPASRSGAGYVPQDRSTRAQHRSMHPQDLPRLFFHRSAAQCCTHSQPPFSRSSRFRIVSVAIAAPLPLIQHCSHC